MTGPFEDLAVRGLAVSRRTLHVPAQSLADAVRLCYSFSPLSARDDEILHADLSPIRGGDRLAKIVRNIRRAGGTSTLHFLTGHVGCGKTTELLRMKERLESATNDASATTVLFLDADRMLDRTDVDLEDILIALWGLIYSQAPEAAARVLGPVWSKQIASNLGSAVANLPNAVPEAVKKVLDAVRLQSAEQKQKVRVGLGSVVPALIDGLNKAFIAIQETPPNEPTEPLVVLIDNLEKLSEGQRAGVERLYLERMVVLKQLNVHLVITVPLYLCYAAAGASLIGLYGGDIVVLPMVEVRKRISLGGGENAGGLRAMADLLEKRVRFDLLFEEGDGAALRIGGLSGGCIRHALRIVQGAVNEHDEGERVTARSVDRSIGSVQADFERALPERYVPILKNIANDNRFPDDCEDDAKRDLLRHLFVLEYQNGNPDPWYAVHPLVERCRKYVEHK